MEEDQLKQLRNKPQVEQLLKELNEMKARLEEVVTKVGFKSFLAAVYASSCFSLMPVSSGGAVACLSDG